MTRVALGIAARMLRGLAADAAWRGRAKTGRTASRSAARVALATALILLVPLMAAQVTDGGAWSLADCVFAGVLLALSLGTVALTVRTAHRTA